MAWYAVNKRILPWRNTTNPYKIWLSEIILQQTRVAQGTKYYLSFIENYPTVTQLANASENEVLKLWQGLGYYSRARNLHFTAKLIEKEWKGKFPNNHADLLKLKGVGTYTAAAIASFAFNLPYPVIDGNVYRVLSRMFGIDNPINQPISNKIFSELANLLIDKKNPAEYNQAIMEFGAMQCLPANPNCNNCTFISSCFAFNQNRVKELPVKLKKTKQKARFFNFLDFQDGEKTILTKRTGNDIWKGLYQFPLVESQKTMEWDEIAATSEIFEAVANAKLIGSFKSFKHQLTHQILHAKFWKVTGKFDSKKLDASCKVIKIKDLEKYPIPRLMELYLES